jgi:16S rRNA processing protein RimM|tara:strand:- start:7982 stop:8485 length:504 start_codon:yes stop_codon:yes gene_type:complete
MSHDNYIIVGKVLNTHGIKGYLTIRTYTSIPEDIFKYPLHIHTKNTIKKIEIEDHNFMPKKTIMKILDVDNIEDADDYIGQNLLVLKTHLPKTTNDEYYWYDLIGSSVINHNGLELGYIDDLFTSGENDILIIKREGSLKEIYIPFLKNHIIDFKDKILTVRWDDEL